MKNTMFWAGILALMIAAVGSSEITNQIDKAKYAALLAQSENIRRLGQDPKNIFVCAYAESLESEIRADVDARVKNGTAAMSSTTDHAYHKRALDNAKRSRDRLVALEGRNCLDITKLSTPYHE